MSLYRNVTDKPWLTRGVTAGMPGDLEKPAFAIPDKKLGLYIFMASASVLFSLLVVSYFIRMGLGDWVPLATPTLVWINTGVLIASSIVFQLCTREVRKDAPSLSSIRWLFLAGGVLAALFIAGQAMVWNQLIATGYHAALNPANGFFYLMTGLHVIHLLGGLWVWSKAAFLMRRVETANEMKLSVELCTTYWHFLLIVWAGLLYLLAAT